MDGFRRGDIQKIIHMGSVPDHNPHWNQPHTAINKLNSPNERTKRFFFSLAVTVPLPRNLRITLAMVVFKGVTVEGRLGWTRIFEVSSREC